MSRRDAARPARRGRARPSRPRVPAGRAGFTLIELLMAIVLFGLVSVGMYNLLFSQSRFFEVEEAGNATQQNVRTALKRIANDILLVGRGVNALSLDNPDVVVPNDGTVAVNTLQSGAITLLSIPDNVPQIPFSATSAKGAQFVTTVDDSMGVARSLTGGDLIIIHDTNLNNSQVLGVTSAVDQGATVRINVGAADSLMMPYPQSTSRMYKLNTVSYRVNTSTASRPHLERDLNGAGWEKMVPGVQTLTFTYYDKANAVVTPTSQTLRKQIRKVKVDVTGRSVRPIDSRGTHVDLTLTTEVTPRNMME